MEYVRREHKVSQRNYEVSSLRSAVSTLVSDTRSHLGQLSLVLTQLLVSVIGNKLLYIGSGVFNVNAES